MSLGGSALDDEFTALYYGAPRRRAQEQVLWVSGNVVGFPHYPVLAIAKLT
jgi:hypothetical protein